MIIKTAIILAAGQGKRLDSLGTIKPLVMVAGKPLIAWQIEKLIEAGFDNLYIIANDKEAASRMKQILAHYEATTGIRYLVKQNDDMLASLASAVNKIEKLKGSFVVTVCDLILSGNPFKLLAQKDFTRPMVLISNDNKFNENSGARVGVDWDGHKINKLAKDDMSLSARDVGIYVFDKNTYHQFFELVAKNNISVLTEALDKYNREFGLEALVMESGHWFDVNIPQTLIRAELFVRKVLHYHEPELKAKLDKIQSIDSNIKFVYKKNIKVELLIKRNIINELEKFEIIPKDAIRSPHFIICDEKTDVLYGQSVYEKFIAQGFHLHKVVVGVGESSKSTQQYIDLAEKILALGVDKKSIIISLGGGVINNLAGFLASTIYRGIGLIHIPSTLMAQCDAAIGLKQGINGTQGKNLLGSYYAPMKIVVDPTLLLTLDDRWIRDGLAECLKHALAQDKKFFEYLLNYQGDIKDIEFLEYIVTKNIQLKIELMENDFKEDNKALVLQYGHEIGHAVEYLSGYSFGHGEGISIGMRVAAELAKIIGVADEQVVQAHIDLLSKYNLPVNIPSDMKAEDLVNVLKYNKKFRGGEAEFALVHKIGSLWQAGGIYTIPCRQELIYQAVKNSYAKQ